MASQATITGYRTYDGQTANLGASVPGMGGLPPGALAALEEKRRIAAAEAAMRMKMQQAQLDAMKKAEAGRMNPAHGAAAPPAETPWYTLQGVARTPVAGFNMTGDYTIDPNKLPPSMRAMSAGFAAPQSAGLGASGAGLGSEPYDPYSRARSIGGGSTGGGGGGSKGGSGGGGGASGASGPDERPDWHGTGTTNAGEQAAVLRTNAANRQAQQDAMMRNASQALLAGMGGYRGNKITPVGAP